MSAMRQDAWSADDDLILAEVTLRHIREGSTQLSAFEEVAERIGRTAAACGFRWNSCVRKNYEASIQIAKEQRKKLGKNKKRTRDPGRLTNAETTQSSSASSREIESTMTLDSVIRFLKSWKGTYQDVNKQIKSYQKRLKEMEEEVEKLRKENEQLRNQVNSVENNYRTVNDDYKTLIQIMDRARKMTVLAEDDAEQRKRFKMDANGNLERVE